MSTQQKPNDGLGKAEFVDKLLSREQLHFKPEDDQEARTISAQWLEEAVSKRARIDISNAVIVGSLTLRNAIFEDEVSLLDCHFEDAPDLSNTTFKRSLNLSGSTFDRGIRVDGALIEGDLILDNSSLLSGEASFTDMRVTGSISLVGADLADDVNANFTRAKVERSIHCLGTLFGGGVDFSHAEIGVGDFRGAMFKRRANFNPSKFNGGVFFRAYPERNLAASVFSGEVDFGATEINVTSDFSGVTFEQNISFNSAKIRGDAVFRMDKQAVTFAGDVNFVNAQIDSNAEFTGAKFTATEGQVNFAGAQVGANAFFNEASFAGTVQFDGIHIARGAYFGSVTFAGRASFRSAKFDGFASFGASASDLHPASFESGAEFIGTQFGADADFEKAQFLSTKEVVSFDSANIKGNVFFRGAIFAGQTSFQSMYISKAIVCAGTVFRQQVSFNSARIDGSAFFQPESLLNLPAASFEGGVDFIAAYFGLDAVFDQVKFTAIDADVKFSRIRVEGNIWFLGAYFSGPANFQAAVISGDAFFREAQFLKESVLSFNAVAFHQGAFFEGTVFEAMVDFRRVQFVGDAFFHGARFLKSADFGGSHFRASALFNAVGTNPGTVFKEGVSFNGVKIDGFALFRGWAPTGLAGASFEGGADFISLEVTSNADFELASFVGAEAAVRFDNVEIGGDAIFRNCQFEGPVSFASSHISRNAYFETVQFHQANYFVNFNTARIDGDLSFNGASFKGGATFEATHVVGAANFANTVFSNSNLPASFDQARIDRNLHFNGAIFNGEARFIGLRVGSQARFENVQFNCESKPVSFDGAEFVSAAFFSQTVFCGEAHFRSHFGFQANFQGAVFKARVTFNGAEFKHRALFHGTVFHGQANFGGARFGSSAEFNGAVFVSDVICDSAQVDEEAHFGGTTFHAPVTFANTKFVLKAFFDTAIFKKTASFRDTSFRVVDFSETGNVGSQKQFQESTDLRGCIYERINGDWNLVFANLSPYDRQPFVQLEKVFRAIGQDREADKVYLQRQHIERNEKWRRREIGSWLFSWLYRLTANYGVRPYRLIVVSFLVLLVGTGTFLQHEALAVKSDKPEVTPPALQSWTPREAFLFSFKQFLPVEIPFASQLIPSDNHVFVRIWLWKWSPSFGALRASSLATFIRIAGWILVPLGVASLTGLLRVKP